jgi:hypothetical protein
MQRYRLVKLDRSEKGTVVPTVPYDRMMFDFSFRSAEPGTIVPLPLQGVHICPKAMGAGS